MALGLTATTSPAEKQGEPGKEGHYSLLGEIAQELGRSEAEIGPVLDRILNTELLSPALSPQQILKNIETAFGGALVDIFAEGGPFEKMALYPANPELPCAEPSDLAQYHMLKFVTMAEHMLAHQLPQLDPDDPQFREKLELLVTQTLEPAIHDLAKFAGHAVEADQAYTEHFKAESLLPDVLKAALVHTENAQTQQNDSQVRTDNGAEAASGGDTLSLLPPENRDPDLDALRALVEEIVRSGGDLKTVLLEFEDPGLVLSGAELDRLETLFGNTLKQMRPEKIFNITGPLPDHAAEREIKITEVLLSPAEERLSQLDTQLLELRAKTEEIVNEAENPKTMRALQQKIDDVLDKVAEARLAMEKFEQAPSPDTLLDIKTAMAGLDTGSALIQAEADQVNQTILAAAEATRLSMEQAARLQQEMRAQMDMQLQQQQNNLNFTA